MVERRILRLAAPHTSYVHPQAGDLTQRRTAAARWNHGSIACRRRCPVAVEAVGLARGPALWAARAWWRRRGGFASQRPWLRAHRPRGSLPRPRFQGAARSGSLIQFSFVFPRRTRPASPPVSGIRPLFSVQLSPRRQHCQAPACPAIGAAHHPVAGGSREHLYVAQSVSACGTGLCIFSFSFSFSVQAHVRSRLLPRAFSRVTAHPPARPRSPVRTTHACMLGFDRRIFSTIPGVCNCKRRSRCSG